MRCIGLKASLKNMSVAVRLTFFVLLKVTLMKLEELDDALGVFSSLGDILLFAFDEMI